MRTRQTVNICNIDKFVENRDKKKYMMSEALTKIEQHIIAEIDHTFPVTEFREWYDSDDDHAFYWNGIKYVWDCNERSVS